MYNKGSALRALPLPFAWCYGLGALFATPNIAEALVLSFFSII